MQAFTNSIGQCATLACLLEATAPKVGNVHRGADFDDLTFTTSLVSAVAIAPAMEAAAVHGHGPHGSWTRSPPRATVVATNTNLGIVLLLAPLAAVPRSEPLTSACHPRNVLSALTTERLPARL